MTTKSAIISLTIVLCALQETRGQFPVELNKVPQHFYEFGPDIGDFVAPVNDDGSTDRLSIDVAFPFYNHIHDSLFVSNLNFVTKANLYGYVSSDQQESIPVGCVPPARHRMGEGSLSWSLPGQRPLDRESPDIETPWTETPLDRHPWTETPSPIEGTWDQLTRQKVTSYRDSL